MTTPSETPVQRYKRAHDLTYGQLAVLWQMRENTLRKLGAGLRPWTPRRAEMIEEFTRGEIKKEELVFWPGRVAA